jgi:carboxymethylenebutenolidase
MNGVTNENEETVSLPSPKPITISPNVVIQPPLTRRGTGPGLILIVPSGLDLKGHNKTLDPAPLQKWAEEGYAVAQIILAEGEGEKFQTHLKEAINGLAELKSCDSTEKMGLICTFSWLLVCYFSDDTAQRTTHRLLKMFQASSTPRKISWRS